MWLQQVEVFINGIWNIIKSSTAEIVVSNKKETTVEKYAQ